MEVKTKIPLTIEGRMEHGEELRIPASWEEFLDALEECEYRIEYDNEEIISFMGYATENHETLTGEIIRLLGNMFLNPSDRVTGSNLALHIPGLVRKYYNADCALIRGISEKVTLRGNMTAVANPLIIVKVLSASTREFDLIRKFRNYRKINSLQQVLFIESTEMLVMSHTCQEGGKRWLLSEYSEKEENIAVLNEGHISMEQLYKRVDFGKI